MDERHYRVVFKGAQSQSFVVAKTAKEASEAAAKGTHAGDEAVVEDGNGREIPEDELAELVRQGR